MKKITKKLIVVLLSIFVICSIVYAASDFTSNTANYKNGNYRDWQQVVSSNGYVFSRKSAWWNNTEKTEATVQIELQTKPKTTTETIPGQPSTDETVVTETLINNADILFICDVSKSAYDDVKLDKSTIEKNIVAPAAKSLLEGKYAGAGNAVAFCEFAQGIFLYGTGSSSPSTCSYLDGTPKGSYSTGNRRGSRADGESQYDETYSALVNSLDKGKAKFYTKASDIEKVINNAGNHNFGNTSISEQNKYTNIDAALLYANYLKNNRSNTSRKMYVIIISDGAPDPIALYSGNNRTSLDGLMTSSSAAWGTNPGKNSNRQWLLQLKYPINMLYYKAASNFKSGGNEIFFIKTGTDDDLNGDVVSFWKNYILGDGSHIKELSSNSQASGISAVRAALDDIRVYLDEVTTTTTTTVVNSATPDQVITKPVAFSCKVTDIINYDLFDIVPNSWSTNIGTASYDSNKKKITWTISGINYGDNFGANKASKLTFKIKLNATGLKKYGYLNTNYIKNVDKTNPDDTNCEIIDTPDPTHENFDVPSPWLPREAPKGTVIERYIKVTGNGTYTLLESVTHNNVELGNHSYPKQKNYNELIYNGFKTESGLISSYSFKKGEKLSTGTPSVTLTADNLNFVITHVFEQPPDFGLRFLHYDESREQYITPGDTVTREFNSLQTVLEKWFASDEDVKATFNSIVTGSDSNGTKVAKIIELIKDKWNEVNFPAIKSLYTANYVNGKLSFTGSIDIRVDSGTPVPLTALVTSNGVQYTPTFDSVKSAVTSKAGEFKDGSKITITFYYVCNRQITVNHLDVDTNQKIGVTPNPEMDFLMVGAEKTYYAKTGKILNNGDSYYEFFNKNKVDSNVGTSNSSVNGTSSSVKVKSEKSNFLLDVNIDFFYKKWWKVSVFYKDIDEPTGNILNPKYYYTKQHDNVTENYIDLTNYKENGLDLHYRYKYVDAKMGNDVKASQNPTKTITINDVTNTVEIIFWYKKLPTITSTIVPETEYELGDPDDPTNPFNQKDEEIIVLDDLFTIKMDIDRYNYGEAGSDVVVSLPFDVYAKADAANERPADGKFFKAATEINVDDFDPAPSDAKKEFKYVFRLPSWVIEKIYDGTDKQTMCHTVIYGPNTNTDGSREVIDEKWIKIRVIGRLYDFTATNLEGDDKWESSLFNGTNKGKEYKADTLPIGQFSVNSKKSTLPYNTNIKTQNPTWKYGMKLGSKFLFSINTKGLISDRIRIIPKLEYYDKNGNKVNNVTFTYKQAGKGEIPYAANNGLVVSNVESLTTPFSTQLTYSKRYNAEVTSENTKANALKAYGEKITPVIREANVSIKNAYASFMPGKVSSFGTFNDLKIPNTLRLPYVNYASTNTALSEVQKIGTSRIAEQNGVLKYINTSNNAEYMQKMTNNGTSSVGLTEDQIVNSLGHWYAEYKLPATLKVKDSSGKYLSDGYIVVKYNIYSEGMSGGKYYKYLSYMSQLRAGNIKYNQWYLENEHITQTNANANVPVYFPQTTANQTGVMKTINISDGFYPVAIYDASISINDELEPVKTH